MHPSYKLKYFKVRNWPQTWIDEALDLARNIWKTHYAPKAPSAGVSSVSQTETVSVCTCLSLYPPSSLSLLLSLTCTPLKGFSLEDVTHLSPSTHSSRLHTHTRALSHTCAHTLEGFQFGGRHASLSLYPFLVLAHTRARTLAHTRALSHTHAHTLEGFQFGGRHTSLSLYPFLVLTHTHARTLTHTCAHP